jgi:hypothetical protein
MRDAARHRKERLYRNPKPQLTTIGYIAGIIPQRIKSGKNSRRVYTFEDHKLNLLSTGKITQKSRAWSEEHRA